MNTTVSVEPWRTEAINRSGWLGLYDGAMQCKQVRHDSKLLYIEAIRHKTAKGTTWDCTVMLEHEGKRAAVGRHAGTTRSQAVTGAVAACINAFFNQR